MAPVVAVDGGTKPFDDATVAELETATSQLTAASRKKPKSAVRVALEKTLGKVESLAKVRVSERSGSVTFEGVPVAALERFARAVLSAKLPE